MDYKNVDLESTVKYRENNNRVHDRIVTKKT